MIALKIIPLDGAPREEPVRAEKVRIGRSPDNDITIHDQSVSRVHASLEQAPGGHVVIEDLGSRNGVLVNGERIQGPTRVTSTDEVRLGDVTLRLIAAGPDVTISDDPFQGKVDTTVLAYEGTGKLDATTFIPLEQITGAAERPGSGAILQFFQEITESVLAARPFGDVIEEIVRQLLKILPEADRACLMLLEGDPPELKPRVARARSGREVRMTVSRTIVGRVVDNLDSVLSANAQEDRRFVGTESLVMQGTFSVMCAPLVAEGKATGVLYVDTLSPFKHFDREQLALFAALGNIAAGHIQRQRLLEEAMERRALERELSQAAAIQRRLLAAEPVNRSGYAFHAANRPCLAVGGDYYDLIDCGDGGVYFAIADVCGKGMGAALLMSMLKAMLRCEVRAGASPLDIGRRVNNILFDSIDSDKFVTMFLGHLDPATGRLTYVNAGHDAPLLLRNGGDHVEELAATGLVAGILPDAPLESAAVELAPGDILYAYTDGIREALAPDQSEFGVERVTELLTANREAEPVELARTMEARVREFIQGGEPQDDMTQLVVRRLA